MKSKASRIRIRPTMSSVLSRVFQYGAYIKQIRSSKQVTQANLAKELGVSQGALSKIESGQLTPSIHLWSKFCEYFGLSMVELPKTSD